MSKDLAVDPAGDGLFSSAVWELALQKYASATQLTVRLLDAEERAVFGPIHPTPLFHLFDEAGYDPGLFIECARRCIAQTEKRPAVLVSQFHGLTVVGASLALEGRVVGAAVGGYAFADFSQVSEIQRLGRQAGISFERLWEIARKQAPVPQRRLLVYGELLQVLGDSLLRENHRARQYEQAAAIVNSSNDAIISTDLEGVTTSWNTGAERLFGYSAREAIGGPIMLLIPADGIDQERAILAHVRDGEKIENYETVQRRKDGTLLDVSLTLSPLRDAEGRIVGTSRIARDTTERKRQERHRELLVNELNHRVKNTLATVQSFALQTLRHAGTLAEGRDASEARLMALSKAHDVLTQEHWERASLDNVVTNAIAPYSGDGHESRFQMAGPIVRLRPKAVLALSIALQELATNAVKYGALSNSTGRVEITWRLIPGDPPRFQLRWTESGGPSVEAPRKRGFGSRLLEHGLARDLAGEVRLSFARRGIVCTIDAPLDEIRGDDLQSSPRGVPTAA
jgi:PAS domain S-box-containing protein